MEAKEALLPDDIFKTGRLLEVPFYQRSYVWGVDEWARLLDDLKNMCEAREPYFLGSVILKKTIDCGPGNDDFASKAIVVDGQQRLTTMQLLLKVIALKTNEGTFDSRFYFQRQTQHSLTKRLYFLHNRNDRTDFERAMAAETATPLDGDSNIIKAFNYFVENIDEDRAWLMNYMDLMQFTQFVLITLSEQDDEQQIFDTINSLGMRLTTAELLKNFFFSKENIETYKTHWEDVFERDDETKAYWDQTITTGRLRRSMIDLFFSAFLQLEADKKDGVTEDERRTYEKSERLFQSYQSFIKNHCGGDPSSLIDALKVNAETFRGLFDPSARERMVGSAPGMDRMNVVIFGLQNSTLIPYVLYLREHIADDAVFDEMLGILEAYVMRRMVLRADTKNYNRFFSGLIREGVATPDACVSASYGRVRARPTFPPSTRSMRPSTARGASATCRHAASSTCSRPRSGTTRTAPSSSASTPTASSTSCRRSGRGSGRSTVTSKRSRSAMTRSGPSAILPSSVRASTRP